jgi:hypothetical protein
MGGNLLLVAFDINADQLLQIRSIQPAGQEQTASIQREVGLLKHFEPFL